MQVILVQSPYQSLVWWCTQIFYRVDEDEPLEDTTQQQDGKQEIDDDGNDSMQSFQTGGAVRPEVKTVFKGDPVDYMKRCYRNYQKFSN